MTKTKSVAGGVLAIIGAVMSFIGTLHLSICALAKDVTNTATSTVTNGELEVSATNTAIVWILGITAFVCAIVGAVFCFKNSLVGGILTAVGTVALIVASAVVGYWAWTVIVAMALLGIGAILAFLVKKPIAGQNPPPAAPTAPPQDPNAN